MIDTPYILTEQAIVVPTQKQRWILVISGHPSPSWNSRNFSSVLTTAKTLTLKMQLTCFRQHNVLTQSMSAFFSVIGTFFVEETVIKVSQSIISLSLKFLKKASQGKWGKTKHDGEYKLMWTAKKREAGPLAWDKGELLSLYFVKRSR